MVDRWAEVRARYPNAYLETYVGEAEAVVFDGQHRFGGWLVTTAEALYVGRQGAMGMGSTKEVERITGHALLPGGTPQKGSDLALIVAAGDRRIEVHLRRGMPFVMGSNAALNPREWERLNRPNEERVAAAPGYVAVLAGRELESLAWGVMFATDVACYLGVDRWEIGAEPAEGPFVQVEEIRWDGVQKAQVAQGSIALWIDEAETPLVYVSFPVNSLTLSLMREVDQRSGHAS